MSDIQNNAILADCAWFADKHRGKYRTSGPHWPLVIRFSRLYDEAVRLQKRVDALEAYIVDYYRQQEKNSDGANQALESERKNMKITIENQNQKGCKHEVGKVYLWDGIHYLLVKVAYVDEYSFVDLHSNLCLSENYESMAELDAANPDDVLVDAELIIRDMKGKI